MGWINKSVWRAEPDDGHFKFLRRIRRKSKIKRIIGWGEDWHSKRAKYLFGKS